MPFLVKGDEVTVLKALSEIRDLADHVIGYDHEARTYRKGVVLADEDVSPVVQKLLEDGDAHTNAMLEKVEDDPEGGALQDIKPVPVDSASPGQGPLAAEAAAGVPDPPGREPDSMNYLENPPGRLQVDKEADLAHSGGEGQGANPGRVQVDEAAKAQDESGGQLSAGEVAEASATPADALAPEADIVSQQDSGASDAGSEAKSSGKKK